MTTLRFDEEAARRVEATYLTPDVVEQRRVVLRRLALGKGERVLDVGVGPGLLAAQMAAEVGAEGLVHGLDISESMLALARSRQVAARAAPVELRVGGAEALPYEDASFDAAVSTQVLEYVPDVPKALGELARVLRPGGRALLLDTDWDSIVWHSSDHARMTRVLAAWDEHLVDPYLPRTLRGSLVRAGFEVERPQLLSMFNVGWDPVTYSGGLLPLVADFVAGRGRVTAEEAGAWAADLRGLGPDYFFSLSRYLFLATKRA